YLAAAGIYALDHHVQRLRDDNDRARRIGQTLATQHYVSSVRPVLTNIVIFDVKPPHTAASFLKLLAEKGIRATAFGPQTIRFVTHLDFTEAMLQQTLAILNELGA
ncbi:MAG TPA: threonine aldolase, partial [Saprospiraceae bacterium]|nr:threonine aldolase [Saprospiraceae bacterium]